MQGLCFIVWMWFKLPDGVVTGSASRGDQCNANPPILDLSFPSLPPPALFLYLQSPACEAVLWLMWCVSLRGGSGSNALITESVYRRHYRWGMDEGIAALTRQIRSQANAMMRQDHLHGDIIICTLQTNQRTLAKHERSQMSNRHTVTCSLCNANVNEHFRAQAHVHKHPFSAKHFALINCRPVTSKHFKFCHKGGKDYLLPEITQVPGGPCHHLHNQHYVTLCVENIRRRRVGKRSLIWILHWVWRPCWTLLGTPATREMFYQTPSFSIVVGLIILQRGEGNFLTL